MNDAQTLARMDQQDAQVIDNIRKYGWHIPYVYGDYSSGDRAHDRVPFAYTVGLFGMGHPELLILGVPPQTAAGVLNELGERVRAGAHLTPGELLTFDGWPHRIIPEQVPNPWEIALVAYRHYRQTGPLIEVLQLSYDDTSGRFPWEPDYAAPDMQPRPGTFRA